ncbi:MAG: DUF1800 family protein [Marinoscillum sp.]
MPLGNLTETLGRKRAGHLLRRACFGASVQDIDLFAGLTAQEAFARLVADNLPDPPLPIDPATGSEWIATGPTDANSEPFELSRFLNCWMLGQTLASDISSDLRPSYSYRERIVFFFHTLFTTKQSTVNSSQAIFYQHALFRQYALDRDDKIVPDLESSEEEPLDDLLVPINIKELTKKICVDNAMLIFLDGRLNVKGNPNENFGRELLELYSIGRGLEGNVPETQADGDYYYYTEQDVQAAAKVLSGFEVNLNFDFNPQTPESLRQGDKETGLPRGSVKGGTIAGSHDNSTKQFSSRFADQVITPAPELLLNGQPTKESVLDEISQLIEMIYDQNATAINICRRLYRFFVYHEVSEALQADIIQEMADILVSNDFKIHFVLEALFTSEHFYEGSAGYADDSYGALIKSPLDLVVGFHKNFNIDFPNYLSQYDTFYQSFTIPLLTQMSAQGLNLYEPYEVAGYPAYHQFPIYNRSWITTNYLTNRYNFIRTRTSNGMNIEMGQVDVLSFVQNNIDNAIARDPQELIITFIEYFLPMSEGLSFSDPSSSELTAERLSYFMNAFLYSPQIDMDPEASWTFRWDNNEDTETMANQLVNLFNAILQSPEYQLM